MNNLVQLLKTRVYLWRKCTAWTSTGWNVQIIGTPASFTSSAVWLPVFAVPAPLLSWAEWRACTPAPRREGLGALMFANLTPPAAGWTRAEDPDTSVGLQKKNCWHHLIPCVLLCSVSLWGHWLHYELKKVTHVKHSHYSPFTFPSLLTFINGHIQVHCDLGWWLLL